jgi:hypothetical protein
MVSFLAEHPTLGKALLQVSLAHCRHDHHRTHANTCANTCVHARPSTKCDVLFFPRPIDHDD